MQPAALLVMENAVCRGRAFNAESDIGLAHETGNIQGRSFTIRPCGKLVLFWPRSLQPFLQVEFDIQVEFMVLTLGSATLLLRACSKGMLHRSRAERNDEMDEAKAIRMNAMGRVPRDKNYVKLYEIACERGLGHQQPGHLRALRLQWE